MGELMSATEVLARRRIDADSEDFEGARWSFSASVMPGHSSRAALRSAMAWRAAISRSAAPRAQSRNTL